MASDSATACPAIRVYVTYTVPLAFGQVIGLSSKKVVESSDSAADNHWQGLTRRPWWRREIRGLRVKTLNGNKGEPARPELIRHRSPPIRTIFINMTFAGPVGTNTAGNTATTSNYSSSEPYASPVQIAFTVTPGATITITNTSGSISYDHATSPYMDPTANSAQDGSASDAAANGIGDGMGSPTLRMPPAR